MGDDLEDPEIGRRRDPEGDVENERAKKLRENDLPIADRCSHERLYRSQLKFLGEEPHGDERKNQDESEPEKDRVKEGFLDGVAHRSLVHERNLEIEINPTNQKEENQHDVGN